MTPQSFGTTQELLSYLSTGLMRVPGLQEALEKVALDRPAPRGQVYITRPSIMQYADPFFPDFYQVGAKITYVSRVEGVQEQFGQILRVSELRDEILERSIYILGRGLAEGILAHEASKKPLPTQALSAKDREELFPCLPF